MEVAVVLLVLAFLLWRWVRPQLKRSPAAAGSQSASRPKAGRSETAPDHLGAVWATGDAAKAVLKKGRETKPTKRWRCCRCGAGFLLPIEPEKVPVPWWYWEAFGSAGWKEPLPWACPECGTFAYTVPV
jgi:hypothetical protein